MAWVGWLALSQQNYSSVLESSLQNILVHYSFSSVKVPMLFIN